MYTVNNEIILCQPDSQKGCCACCGLFNFQDISRESLSNFLMLGTNRLLQAPEEPTAQLIKEADATIIRDITSHICPHQGFFGNANPGCLLHPNVNKVDKRDISLFGAEICGSFLCATHTILSNAHKKILIEYIEDWYYYSIAIIDPESLIWIIECLEGDYSMDFNGNIDNKKAIINTLSASLKIHSEYLNKIKTPIFHYSVSEYNEIKHIFTLQSSSEGILKQREVIKKKISSLLI